MDVAQLQSAIQAHGYDQQTATQQLEFLNDTYRELHSKARWEFLEAQDKSLSTTTGTNIYSWPMTNFRNIDAVRFTQVGFQGYINPDYVSPQDFRDKENSYPEPGPPRYWTQLSNQLHVWPVPDGVYNIVVDYIIEPPDLVSSTDVPIIPTAYHDVLVWGALRSITLRERDFYTNEIATQQYESRLKRMQDEFTVRQRQTSSHVKKSGFYGRNELRYDWRY